MNALAHLKVSPHDQAENVTALARAERLYEELLGDKREALGEWITRFLSALESDDLRIVAQARALLLQRIEAIEPESLF